MSWHIYTNGTVNVTSDLMALIWISQPLIASDSNWGNAWGIQANMNLADGSWVQFCIRQKSNITTAIAWAGNAQDPATVVPERPITYSSMYNLVISGNEVTMVSGAGVTILEYTVSTYITDTSIEVVGWGGGSVATFTSGYVELSYMITKHGSAIGNYCTPGPLMPRNLIVTTEGTNMVQVRSNQGQFTTVIEVSVPN